VEFTSNNRIEVDFSLLGKARKYETQPVNITNKNSYFVITYKNID
jgi:hypothetical protein